MMKVSLIDADSIIYIAHWNTIKKSWDKKWELIKTDIDSLISKILINTIATHYLGFLGKGNSFRKTIDPGYKSNRDKLIRPPLADECKGYMKSEWGFIITENYEADDCIRILSNRFENTIMCSADNDIMLLEGTHYNFKKHEFITTTKFQADFKFWKDMITGQTGDNIKGLPGKGKIYANNLLISKLEEEYPLIVFSEYLKFFGQVNGIKEFYKNYKCLYILEEDETFKTPELLEVKIEKLVL